MYLLAYGTLKRNRNNHEYLNNATYMGNYYTSGDFTLIVSGLPFLVRRRSERGVKGEVYKVNSDILRQIDKLEGHPSLYRREVITVYNEDTKELLEVYTYTHPDIFNHNFEYDYKTCYEY